MTQTVSKTTFEEELIEKGFAKEAHESFTGWRKDGLYIRQFNGRDYCTFKVDSDHMVIDFKNMPCSFKSFREEAFDRMRDLFEPVDVIRKTDWGHHAQKETLLTWFVLNGAEFKTPYEHDGETYMNSDLRVNQEYYGYLNATFRMDGSNMDLLFLMIEGTGYHVSLTFPLTRRRLTPSKIESEMRKSLRDEFQKCADSLNGLL